MDKGKILIADDDDNIIELINETLTQKDFTILKTHDGCSVIPKAKKEHPDLIILDVMLPNLDGYRICQKLRELDETKEIPVIVMSAHTTRQLIMNFHSIGFNNYLLKPFNGDKLIKLVDVLYQKPDPKNIH